MKTSFSEKFDHSEETKFLPNLEELLVFQGNGPEKSIRVISADYLEKSKGSRLPFRFSKGAIQVDFIIAVGLFLLLFAFIVLSFNNFVTPIRNIADIATLRSEAESLRSLADNGFVPVDWPRHFRDSSTVLLLRLDNSTNDTSGLGNDGTSFNGTNCDRNVEGKMRTACRFDGFDDFIRVSDNANIRPSAAVSAEAWFRTNSSTKNLVLIVFKGDSCTDTDNPNYCLKLNATSRFAQFQVNRTIVNYTANMADNEWHHIVGTYNSTEQLLRIYVDGVLRNSTNDTGTGAPISADQLFIGGRDRATANTFNGTIDEVYLYNRTLNETEVREHFEFGKKLRRLGLNTKAYKFYILINNTAGFLRNQSDPVRNITNEVVRFNISHYIDADLNSVVVYDDFNRSVTYERAGSNFSFIVNVNASQARWYTVYADDDSARFIGPTNTVSGVDNLTETVYVPEKINVIQYDKIAQVNVTNASHIKSGMGFESMFRISLQDLDTNVTVFDYGEIVPKTGNVVSLQRFVLFQNATGGIRKGKMIVKVW